MLKLVKQKGLKQYVVFIFLWAPHSCCYEASVASHTSTVYSLFSKV